MGKMVYSTRIKKILAVVFLLTLTGMTELFAIDLYYTVPQLAGSHPNKGTIQEELNRVFTEAVTDYQRKIQGIDDNPQKMIGAFATSSVFSSTGASLRTFQGYDSFALTLGAMAGVQLNVGINSLIRNTDYIGDRFFDDMNRDGDIQLGINPQIINAQLGINASKFLLKGLYVGFKGGYMNLNFENFHTSFQTWSVGGMINYQLVSQKRMPDEIFIWRGLNVGTGFIYQRTSINLDVPLMPVEDTTSGLVNIGSTGVALNLGDPVFRFRFNVSSYTVPLEAVTSLRLLGFVNFSIGGGVDFGFGSASMKGSLDSRIELTNLPSGLYQERAGSLYISMGGTNSPVLINPKIMGSLAFSAGPAIILDIPITYYFLNNGYSVGVTFGVAI